MKTLSFRARVLLTILISCLICTVSAIVVARLLITRLGNEDLVARSAAILSRVEVVREYVAGMDVLDGLIKEAVSRFPDGKLPKADQDRILKAVPIFASFSLGNKRAADDHYQFRVFSGNARKKENEATPEEVKLLEQLKSPDAKQIVVTACAWSGRCAWTRCA